MPDIYVDESDVQQRCGSLGGRIGDAIQSVFGFFSRLNPFANSLDGSALSPGDRVLYNAKLSTEAGSEIAGNLQRFMLNATQTMMNQDHATSKSIKAKK
jgi:hypothetical protein